MWSLMNHLSTRRSLPRIIRYFSIMAASSDLPSSLTGNPTLALVPPGKCQFSTDLTVVPLLKKWEISPTSFVLRFGLPDTSKPLNLSTCACILAYDELLDRDGHVEGVVRPYTPISTNAQIGSFDLLVKNYGDQGRMSTHLCSLEVGREIAFKHVDGNVKIQAPFAYKKVCMLVGGTGITPMVQALHAILGDPESDVEVVVLYGSRESRDILGKDLLDSWVQQHPDRLTVEHILSHEPENSNWAGARGHITKDMIQKYFPPPADKSMIVFICGPPPMYNALCGPREEKKVSGLLNEMGYSANQVYKF